VTSRYDELERNGGSFRDPAGFVFHKNGVVYRQVNKNGAKDYDFFMESGLYRVLVDKGLLLEHNEINNLSGLPSDKLRYRIIRPTLVPFISYPYEWSFSQLKAAALLTIKIQKLALEHGMILKDASAYNVQFIGNEPVFIDSLSFRIYEEGSPWDGYKQFCEHFVAPLALSVYGPPEVLKVLRTYIDGIPLTTARKLLPRRAGMRKGIFAHIGLHARSQQRYDKAGQGEKSFKQPKVSKLAMEGLISSLQKTVKKLNLPRHQTEWGDYYNDTNYSGPAFTAKKKIVENYIKQTKPANVWDLGANDGTFSEIAAKAGAYVVASDIDPIAVELNYLKKRPGNLAGKILPITQDLANPSPALGWAHRERLSFVERGPADTVLALALIHHLAIGNNLPFASIAEFFAGICKYLIIEFIPKSDSKVKILLHRRFNQFSNYDEEHFKQAFERYFKIVSQEPVRNSQRVIYLFKVKN
jgi:ribosomal protein L11 methylase PrmA